MARVSFTLRSEEEQQGSYLGGAFDVPPVPPEVLSEAVLWLDAAYSEAGEQIAANQGTGGSALNANYGSTVIGTYVYGGVARIPGLASNNLSVPDSPALDITGVLEVTVRIETDDPATLYQSPINHYDGVNGWQLFSTFNATGVPALKVKLTGTFADVVSGAADPNAGVDHWLRASCVAATGAVTFSSSLDGVTFTPFGSGSTTSGTFSNASTVLLMGEYASGGSLWAGKLREAVVKSNGSTVLDVDLSGVSNYATSFTATTGQTVTVNSTRNDTNDPLFLPHTGENYVHFPGTGNTLSVPGTGITPAGDMEVLLRMKKPGASDGFCIGLGWSGGSINWFQDGTIYLSIDIGGGFLSNNSLATPTATAGTTYWIRVRRTSSSGVVTMAIADDSPDIPTVWTSVGVSGTQTAGALAAFGDTYAVCNSASPASMTWYRVVLRHAFDGANVLDINAATDIDTGSETSFTATTGQTVTVTRALSGRKTALVTRPIWLFGTDDYLEVADNALLDFGADDDFTVLAVMRQFAAPTSFGIIADKSTGLVNGWSFQSKNDYRVYVEVDDGTNQAASNALTSPSSAGALSVRYFKVDRTADTLVTGIDGSVSAPTSIAAVGSLASAVPLRVGRYATANNFMDMELVALTIWPRALTTDEIAEIRNYYGRTGVLPTRVDDDYKLRFDELLLAPDLSPIVGSYFEAASHCYGEVDLSWSIEGLPRTTPIGVMPEISEIVLVYSDKGEPQTLASGDILTESGEDLSYTHSGVQSGRWAYYSLFVHYESTGGDDYYERVASLSVLVPYDYGSTLQLWKRIPEFYRIQDSNAGSTEYPACIGQVDITGRVGPLFKYLSIIGFDMDRMRTTIDYTMGARDPDVAHTEVLDALAEQMGITMRSSDLGASRLRRVLGDIGEYRRTKGTPAALEYLGQAITGGDVEVDVLSGDITVYSQRVNYITDPKDGTGIVTYRAATDSESTSPLPFSVSYDSATSSPTVSGTKFTRGTQSAAVVGATGDTVMRIPNWFGHGTDDLLAHNAATATWNFYSPLTGQTQSFIFGPAGCTPVWGKFDGVNTQVAAFLNGVWYIRSVDGLSYATAFYGLAGDIPLSGFDGDGNGTDVTAVVRPSWTWFLPDGGSFSWGVAGDELVAGPWVTAGTSTAAVWRPSEGSWFIHPSGGVTLGTSGDIPVPADYDGDGLMEAGIYRPSSQEWYHLTDAGVVSAPTVFGTATCVPLVGNWRGAGTELAYWEAGQFFTRDVTNCALVRVTSVVPVRPGDRACFSVHSNIGTDAMRWARLVKVSSPDEVVGFTSNPTLADGARAFEIAAFVDKEVSFYVFDENGELFLDENGQPVLEESGNFISPTSPTAGTWTDTYIEFLVDLRGAPEGFVLELMLAELNRLDHYFDGDTKRGGWLIDASSISDYRWAGVPSASVSLYAEDYTRTSGVMESLLIDECVPINETSSYQIVSYDAVPGF